MEGDRAGLEKDFGVEKRLFGRAQWSSSEDRDSVDGTGPCRGCFKLMGPVGTFTCASVRARQALEELRQGSPGSEEPSGLREDEEGEERLLEPAAHLERAGAQDRARPSGPGCSPAPSPGARCQEQAGTADKEPGPEPSGHRGQEGAARGRGRGGGGGQRHRGAEPGSGRRGKLGLRCAANKRLLLPAERAAVGRGSEHHGPQLLCLGGPAEPVQPACCPAPGAAVSTGTPGRGGGEGGWTLLLCSARGSGVAAPGA